jgi:hypothetical protein
MNLDGQINLNSDERNKIKYGIPFIVLLPTSYGRYEYVRAVLPKIQVFGEIALYL